MPKKAVILDKLPDNFSVKRVLGPKEFRSIGNGGYVLLPISFKNSKNLFVVDGEFVGKKKDSERQNKCENCGSDDDVVSCPHFNVSIGRSCCGKCPILIKCPIRNPDGSR